ncbi:hypothetical protein [Myroides sp. DW712]|uniref:hypothetical protein n=1 Tax=Myroides sp. DW712 TaxID=3389800 RepID=UPI00397CEA83
MFKLSEIKEFKYEILIIFFGSLLSFYFPSLGGIRIFDFVSLFLLFFCFKKKRLRFVRNLNINIFFLFFGMFISISFIISILNNAVDIHIPRIVGTYIAILYALLFFSFFSNNVKGLVVGIKYTVYLHATFFYIQFLLFNIAGHYVDLIQPITGNSSRNMGGKFNIDTAIRASGLYSEPASYSLFILTFMSIYIYFKKKVNTIDVIVLTSVLLSMSSSGLVYLIVFILVFFFYYSKFNIWRKLGIFSLIACMGLFVINSKIIDFDYIFNKTVNYEESGSYQYRVGNTNKVQESLDDWQVVLGIGYANMDIKDNKGSTYSALFIEQGYLLGFMFLFALFILLYSFKTDLGIIAYIFLLLLGTHSFSQIQFWIWILSILIIANFLSNERQDIQLAS